MNVCRVSFESGCASEPSNGMGSVEYDIFRIQDKLYSRCVIGEHRTMSSNLKTHDMWKAIRTHWIEYHKSIGDTVLDCKVPRGKNQKRKMINAKMARTLLLRKQLTEAGVLA